MLFGASESFHIGSRLAVVQTMMKEGRHTLTNAALYSTIMTTSIPLTAVAADLDPSIGIVRPVLDILINTLSVFFLCRVVISWYPKTDLKQFPYSAIVWPTEPLLEPVRGLVPPVKTSIAYQVSIYKFFLFTYVKYSQWTTGIWS